MSTLQIMAEIQAISCFIQSSAEYTSDLTDDDLQAFLQDAPFFVVTEDVLKGELNGSVVKPFGSDPSLMLASALRKSVPAMAVPVAESVPVMDSVPVAVPCAVRTEAVPLATAIPVEKVGELRQGVSPLCQGVGELRQGISELHRGVSELHQGVPVPTASVVVPTVAVNQGTTATQCGNTVNHVAAAQPPIQQNIATQPPIQQTIAVPTISIQQTIAVPTISIQQTTPSVACENAEALNPPPFTETTIPITPIPSLNDAPSRKEGDLLTAGFRRAVAAFPRPVRIEAFQPQYASKSGLKWSCEELVQALNAYWREDKGESVRFLYSILDPYEEGSVEIRTLLGIIEFAQNPDFDDRIQCSIEIACKENEGVSAKAFEAFCGVLTLFLAEFVPVSLLDSEIRAEKEWLTVPEAATQLKRFLLQIEARIPTQEPTPNSEWLPRSSESVFSAVLQPASLEAIRAVLSPCGTKSVLTKGVFRRLVETYLRALKTESCVTAVHRFIDEQFDGLKTDACHIDLLTALAVVLSLTPVGKEVEESFFVQYSLFVYSFVGAVCNVERRTLCRVVEALYAVKCSWKRTEAMVEVSEAIEKAFQPSDQLLRKSEFVGIMMELFNAEERFLSTVFVSWSCLV